MLSLLSRAPAPAGKHRAGVSTPVKCARRVNIERAAVERNNSRTNRRKKNHAGPGSRDLLNFICCIDVFCNCRKYFLST
jgi:hypothetical protein